MTTGTIPRSSKASSRRLWPIPLLLTLPVFAAPSLLGGRPTTGPEASALIRDVLTRPLSESAVPGALLPAKLLLLAVAVLGLVGIRQTPRIVLAYYSGVLILVALFQNAADLGIRGFAFLTGNAVSQLAVALICLVGLRRVGADAGPLHSSRLWVLPFMLLAWAYPYAVVTGSVQPSTSLVNGAGLTYCMITPVVAGVMLVRPQGFPRVVAVAVASLGVVFGLLNMLTWFVLSSESRWMGVLHVPLLVISVVLLITAWRAHDA